MERDQSPGADGERWSEGQGDWPQVATVSLAQSNTHVIYISAYPPSPSVVGAPKPDSKTIRCPPCGLGV